jgi:hypothetical protein
LKSIDLSSYMLRQSTAQNVDYMVINDGSSRLETLATARCLGLWDARLHLYIDGSMAAVCGCHGEIVYKVEMGKHESLVSFAVFPTNPSLALNSESKFDVF